VEELGLVEGEMSNGQQSPDSYHGSDDSFESDLINSLSVKQRDFFFSHGIGITHFNNPNGYIAQYDAATNNIRINDAKQEYILQDGTIFKRELLHAKQNALGMNDNHSCREFQEHVIGDILYTQRDGIMPTSCTINTDDPNYGSYKEFVENSANGVSNVISFSNTISSYYDAFCDNYHNSTEYQTNNRNYYYDYNWINILDFFDLLP